MSPARRRSGRGSGCRKYARSLLTILIFAILFAVAGAFFFWRALTTPYRGFTAPKVQVEVRKGWTSATILEQMRKHGVLRDDFMPLVYLKSLRRGASLKAGVYEFSGSLSAIGVLEKLIAGDVILKSVTVREGLDRFAIGELMAAEGFGTAEQWRSATGSGELVADIDSEAESLEGYLFPDTYKLTPGSPVKAIVALMVQNFRKNFGGELAYLGSGLDLHDTVTLASIVETEARVPAERPMIASVYLNRIKRNMPLQADPTVIYAMKLAGTWGGNIRKADLRADAPYNTYVRRGFPPGPIANPGLASLKAAANPARTEYLYFVSRNDGTHVFAKDLAEHNRNVVMHQKRGRKK